MESLRWETRGALTVIAAGCIVSMSPSAGATELGDAAEGLAPGTWVEFQTLNLPETIGHGPHVGNVLPYAFTGPWDPLARRLIHFGTDHNGDAQGAYVIEYDDDTNAWSAIVQPSGGWSHGYDHMTVDPETGRFYLIRGAYRIATLDPGAGSWGAFEFAPVGIPSITFGHDVIDGQLVIYNCGHPGGEVLFVDPASAALTETVSGFGGEATYHCFLEYSPAKDVAVFGGGNANGRSLWRLNADRTVTQLDDSPVDTGVQRANITHDPGSGMFLAWGWREFYQLDPEGAGTWVRLEGEATPPDELADPANPGAPRSVISTAVSNYNVNMYTSCFTGADCRVHLYKHSDVPGPGEETGNPPDETDGDGDETNGGDATDPSDPGTTSTTSPQGDSDEGTSSSSTGLASNGTDTSELEEPESNASGCACIASGAPPSLAWAWCLVLLGLQRRRG